MYKVISKKSKKIKKRTDLLKSVLPLNQSYELSPITMKNLITKMDNILIKFLQCLLNLVNLLYNKDLVIINLKLICFLLAFILLCYYHPMFSKLNFEYLNVGFYHFLNVEKI